MLVESVDQSFAPRPSYLGSCSQTLAMNVEDTLKPKAEWLRNALGASDKHIASTIRSFPAFLALSLDNLESKVTTCSVVLTLFR